MSFHLREVHWGGEMPDRSKGNGSYCACWLLLGHAARAMPLGGFGQLPELLRIQNRGPFIFRSRPRWSIASKLITSAAALKRASSSRWQSCWQCCCQSSRTMLPAEPATTPCDTMQPSRSIACCLPSSCSLHWPSCSCCCATINDQVVVHGRGLRLR